MLNNSLLGIFNNAGMEPLSGYLDAITYRQKLNSQNIANVNTPGYIAKEASFGEIISTMNNPQETRLSQKMGSMMQLSSASHSTGHPTNLQHEMVEMQKNMMFYNMATRRLSTVISNLRTATNIGR